MMNDHETKLFIHAGKHHWSQTSIGWKKICNTIITAAVSTINRILDKVSTTFCSNMGCYYGTTKNNYSEKVTERQDTDKSRVTPNLN